MGHISEKEYQTQPNELHEQMTSAQLSNRGTMIDFERAAQRLGNIKELWGHTTLEERKIWFKLMFEKIYV
jgi:hypothetical protein